MVYHFFFVCVCVCVYARMHGIIVMNYKSNYF